MSVSVPIPGPATVSDAHGTVAGMLPIDEAINRGVDLCWPVSGQEKLQLLNAHHRVLFYAVKSRYALPLFDCSAVDGYALRLADLAGDGPWQLETAAGINASEMSNTPLPPGTALAVGAGAALPSGADTVLPQEAVTPHPGGITIHGRPECGANIRLAGEDVQQGTTLAEAGRLIDPRIAAVLSAAGQAQVVVRRRVLVALFSIGSELRPLGRRPGPGQIWDANRSHLTAALAKPWLEVMDLGTVPDTPQAITTALERASYAADLVITSGSTGGGRPGMGDNMRIALEAVGAESQPVKLALHRAKPLLLGRIGKAVHLGLPGNPVSSFITWHVIGARLAEALAGLAPGTGLGAATGLRRILVHAGFALDRHPGLAELLPARLSGLDTTEIPIAETLPRTSGHRVHLLAEAEGLIHIRPDIAKIEPGDLVEFLPF